MVEELGTEVEPTEAEPQAKYDLHITVPNEMRQKLKEAAELAALLGDIPKPDLVNLMNLFIFWGFSILKRKGYDRMGYR